MDTQLARDAKLLATAWTLRRTGRFQELLELLEGLDPALIDAQPQLGYLRANAVQHLGRHAEALRLTEELLVFHRNTSDQWAYRSLLLERGLLLLMTGRNAEAKRQFEELIPLAIANGDEITLANVYNNVGVLHAFNLEHGLAASAYERALLLCRHLKRQDLVATAHSNRGLALKEQGRLEEADRMFANAIQLAFTYDYPHILPAAMLERALVLSAMGDEDFALATAARCREIAGRLDMQREVGEAERVLGILAMRRRDFAAARRHLRNSLARARRTRTALLQAECHEELAALAMQRGDRARAGRHARRALRLLERQGTPARARAVASRLAEALDMN